MGRISRGQSGLKSMSIAGNFRGTCLCWDCDSLMHLQSLPLHYLNDESLPHVCITLGKNTHTQPQTETHAAHTYTRIRTSFGMKLSPDHIAVALKMSSMSQVSGCLDSPREDDSFQKEKRSMAGNPEGGVCSDGLRHQGGPDLWTVMKVLMSLLRGASPLSMLAA